MEYQYLFIIFYKSFWKHKKNKLLPQPKEIPRIRAKSTPPEVLAPESDNVVEKAVKCDVVMIPEVAFHESP